MTCSPFFNQPASAPGGYFFGKRNRPVRKYLHRIADNGAFFQHLPELFAFIARKVPCLIFLDKPCLAVENKPERVRYLVTQDFVVVHDLQGRVRCEQFFFRVAERLLVLIENGVVMRLGKDEKIGCGLGK